MSYKFNVFTGNLDYYIPASAGAGDVIGPGSATDENIAVFDGVTGKLLKDGGVTVSGLQPIDGALTSISALTYVSPSFIKLTANDTYAVRTLAETLSDIGAAPALGADDNYVTNAEKTVIGNTSGANTGDQTSLTGISDTKANFNTALSDGSFTFSGDAPTTHTHELAAGATDITALAAELNVFDLSETALTAGWGYFADAVSTATWRKLLGSEITNDESWTGATDISGKADIDQTMYIGTTAVAINRASATLNLAGIGTFNTHTIPGGTGTLALTTDITGTNSGTNTGDEVVATGAELTTGTDDVKYASAKAIKDSHNVPSVAPGTDGYVLTSNGTDWVSEASAGGGGGITVETKTDNYSVEIADSGKLLVMNSADDKIFSLPSVAAGDIGTRFYFSKIGVGKVTIDAADSDKISDSGAGDTIYNDQTLEVYATIHLMLVSATQWAIIGADGIWVTTD